KAACSPRCWRCLPPDEGACPRDGLLSPRKATTTGPRASSSSSGGGSASSSSRRSGTPLSSIVQTWYERRCRARRAKRKGNLPTGGRVGGQRERRPRRSPLMNGRFAQLVVARLLRRRFHGRGGGTALAQPAKGWC